jgi:NAD(P)-dependent dehydrogenase (short-subunit alcohol dehydrogenase family)
MDFSGVALITGVSSGIGWQTAVLYAREGYLSLAITNVNHDTLTETE